MASKVQRRLLAIGLGSEAKPEWECGNDETEAISLRSDNKQVVDGRWSSGSVPVVHKPSLRNATWPLHLRRERGGGVTGY